MTASVLCVIPAKRRSRRLSRKNLRPLAGVPLVLHSVRAALAADGIVHVAVSTDCPEIAELCTAEGADVPALRDARHSRDDVHASVPVIDLLQALGGASRFSHCAMLLPTSPLRGVKAIEDVVSLSTRHHHNVVSVTPLGKNLLHLRVIDEDGALRPIADKVPRNFQSDAAPALYALNGSVYCAPSAELIEHRSFHYGEPLAYAMSAANSVDVDTEADLELAETLLRGLGSRSRGATK